MAKKITKKQQEQQDLMKSLTEEQRKGIADIVLSADIEYDFTCNTDGGSWEPDVRGTLQTLSDYFNNYKVT